MVNDMTDGMNQVNKFRIDHWELNYRYRIMNWGNES